MGRKRNEESNIYHIGFYLDLEKPSDMIIYHILNTIPTYDSKTSFIKRAIAFYKKHCNDANDNIGILDEERHSLNSDVPVIHKEIKKETANNQNKKKNTKKENPVVKQQVVEEPKHDENDIYVKNDSEISNDIDYTSFVENFFS